MKRAIQIFIIMLPITLFVVGVKGNDLTYVIDSCTGVIEGDESNITYQVGESAQAVSTSPYISITATSLNSENHFYIDNLIDNSVVEKYVTKDTSQYPLGIVDSKNQRVYYSYRFAHADQLVMYDMISGETKQLTHNLYAINMIIPTENEVYMLASEIVNGTKTRTKLIKYDFEKEECESITDDITEVVSMAYCSGNKSLYFSCYNWQEQMQLKKEYSADRKKQPIPKNAKYSIYKYDCTEGEVEEILTTDLLIAYINISLDGDIAILRTAESLFGQRSVYLFDINKKEKLEEIVVDNILRVEHIAISPDKKGIYFTGIKNPTEDYDPNQFGVEAPPNSLLYMDFETHNIMDIVSFKEQFINNFLLFE